MDRTRPGLLALFCLLLAPLVLGGCATTSERLYAAPTDANVTARLEAAYDGRGQHILVENRSTVEITITSLNLTDCENVKNRCGVTRLRRSLSPGERYRLATVEPENAGRAFNFRYGWTWEASGAVPEIPRQPPGGRPDLEPEDVTAALQYASRRLDHPVLAA